MGDLMAWQPLADLRSTTEYQGDGFLRHVPSVLDLDTPTPRDLGRIAVRRGVDLDAFIRENYEPLSDEAAEFLKGYWEDDDWYPPDPGDKPHFGPGFKLWW